MFRSYALRNTAVALLMASAAWLGCNAANRPPIPAPATDSTVAQTPGKQTAVFAGGCFWGVQTTFQRIKGVEKTWAGYSGGTKETANYNAVSSETTGDFVTNHSDRRVTCPDPRSRQK